MEYKERYAEAVGMHEMSLIRVEKEPEPEGQKFPIGSRVRIADDLGRQMKYFKSGCNATVKYTFAHCFGGNNVKSYCLNIDDYCDEVCWYEEHQLTLLDD